MLFLVAATRWPVVDVVSPSRHASSRHKWDARPASPCGARPRDFTMDEKDDKSLYAQARQLLSAGHTKADRGDATGAVQLYEQVRACGRRIKDVELAKEVEGWAVEKPRPRLFQSISAHFSAAAPAAPRLPRAVWAGGGGAQSRPRRRPPRSG